jgi:hypothetical protein
MCLGAIIGTLRSEILNPNWGSRFQILGVNPEFGVYGLWLYIDIPMDGWVYPWIYPYGCIPMDGWIYPWIYPWMDGYTHGYIHMDIVMDASMGIPMDIVMDASISTFIIDSSHIGINTSYSYGPFYLVMYRL